MRAETRIERLAADVRDLHERRVIPPLVAHIRTLPTETLVALRDALETGDNVAASNILKGDP